MIQADLSPEQVSTSEDAIRQVIERLGTGFASKNGALFASAFAEVHDYVVVNGMFVPNMTREANAQVHQELFDGTRMGALGNDLSKLSEPTCVISGIRFLSPTIAVAHIATEVGGKPATIATAVMQQQAGEWLIVSFHNAMVLTGPDGPPG